ncbi:MAG: hypothetical protein ACYTEL_04280 [Planctomycetota bacterium]|jgi:hypothetical protein
MLRRILVIAVTAAIIGFGLAGCKKSPGPTDAEPNAAEPEPKTKAEYEAEAEKEITKENMQAELEKMEAEIEREARTQP